jgi:cytochrome c oxidase assembly protein subunit 15
VLVTVQVILGIATVLTAPYIVFAKFGVFETIAEAHQLVALILLMSVVANLYISGRRTA